jgi:hypothetical protein
MCLKWVVLGDDILPQKTGGNLRLIGVLESKLHMCAKFGTKRKWLWTEKAKQSKAKHSKAQQSKQATRVVQQRLLAKHRIRRRRRRHL